MSRTASRPAPLRVQVLDIATRASLVTPLPPRDMDSVPPADTVLQRPVRIISDPPPGFAIGSSEPAPPPEPAGLRRDDGPLAEDAWTDRHPRADQTAFVDDEGSDGFDWLGRASSEEDYAQNCASPAAGAAEESQTLREEPTTDEAASLADASLDDAPLDDVSLDDVPLDPPATEDWEPEIESLDSLELGDALDQLELGEDLGQDADPAERHPTPEVSVPPPAPPQALSRAASSPWGDSDERALEFEEIEVEPGDPQDDEDEEIQIPFVDSSTPPPPPPLGALAIPEPPSLTALAGAARVPELRPSRPRAQAWWESFFDDDYLRTVRAPTREQIARQCDFIETRLGLKPGATVLDVGCGLGMQVLELASRGYLGVGLDLSLPMLSRAAEEAQSRGLKINFLHADMREMNFDGSFDAVVCLGTTLGYFDDETNRKIAERLCRALKPGGVLLLEVVNRDHVIGAQPNLIWFEGDGCVCMEESDFNFFASRLHVKRTVILDNGRQTETEYALRLYSLHELGQILNSVGFRVTEVSGREAIPGVFFGQQSPSILIVAERRIAPEAPAAPTTGD